MVETVLERILVRSRLLAGAALAAALVICSLVVRDLVIRIKGDRRDYSLEVSGAARRTARAQSATWSGTVEVTVDRVSDGHEKLEGVRDRLREFLTGQGIDALGLRFPSVDVQEVRRADGRYNTKVVGYVLRQRMSVVAADGRPLEAVAHRSSELIEAAGIAGAEFAWKPNDVEYSYDDLDGLKQQVLGLAVQNAKARAASIAQSAGVHLAELRQLQLGDIEVRTPGSTNRYSDSEPSPTKDIVANVQLLYHLR